VNLYRSEEQPTRGSGIRLENSTMARGKRLEAAAKLRRWCLEERRNKEENTKRRERERTKKKKKKEEWEEIHPSSLEKPIEVEGKPHKGGRNSLLFLERRRVSL
jgi:hypothetical protein